MMRIARLNSERGILVPLLAVIGLALVVLMLGLGIDVYLVKSSRDSFSKDLNSRCQQAAANLPYLTPTYNSIGGWMSGFSVTPPTSPGFNYGYTSAWLPPQGAYIVAPPNMNALPPLGPLQPAPGGIPMIANSIAYVPVGVGYGGAAGICQTAGWRRPKSTM